MMLRGRYQVLAVLGRGTSGTTYEAEDLGEAAAVPPPAPEPVAVSAPTERPGPRKRVAIKELSLRGLEGWQRVELLEREGQLLASLDHPALPRHLESFTVEDDGDVRFYLVQELLPGQSLRTRVQQGWRADEAIATQVALELLDVLQYLHTRPVPVVHRDVAPQNLLLDELTGRVSLVDLGSAAVGVVASVGVGVDAGSSRPLDGASLAADPFGSTPTGTPGFQAPEQIRGRATPATDLYGLGATLVYLLTGASPTALPERRLRVHLSAHPALRVLSPGLQRWLARLLEPAPEDRFLSAQAARLKLRRLLHGGAREQSALPRFGALAAGAGLVLLGAFGGMLGIGVCRRAAPPVAPLAAPMVQLHLQASSLLEHGSWSVCGLRCRVQLRFKLERSSWPSPIPGPLLVPLARLEQDDDAASVNLIADDQGIRLHASQSGDMMDLRPGRSYKAVLVTDPMGQHLLVKGRRLRLGPASAAGTRVHLAPGGTFELGGWKLKISGVRVQQQDAHWQDHRGHWRHPLFSDPFFDP